MKQKDTRGGARNGAGRKDLVTKRRISVTIDIELADLLKKEDNKSNTVEVALQKHYNLSKSTKRTHMIYLISIPHTMSPSLQHFSDERRLLNYANDKAAEKGGEYFETLEAAKEYLTHDLSSGIWIENESDLEYALNYRFDHKKHEVRALAESIDIETLRS